MSIQVGNWGLIVAGTLLCIPFFVLTPVPMLAQSDLVSDVRAQLARNSVATAESELRAYKAQHGVTPEYLEALSWMARAAAAAKQWDQATTYATETRTLCEQQLTLTTTKA